MVSQKCQYALRALFELAKRFGQGPVKVGEIAEAQAIPARFLEVILSELRQAGFTDSRRGSEGGYLLLQSPRRLTVGEVMRFVEGPIGPVGAGDLRVGGGPRGTADGVFQAMWSRAERALSEIYDRTTFQDLIDEEARMRRQESYSYAI